MESGASFHNILRAIDRAPVICRVSKRMFVLQRTGNGVPRFGDFFLSYIYIYIYMNDKHKHLSNKLDFNHTLTIPHIQVRYVNHVSSQINSELLTIWCYMGLLPDTQNCGQRMGRECRKRFPICCGLAIPTCITAHAWRTCRDACRDR